MGILGRPFKIHINIKDLTIKGFWNEPTLLDSHPAKVGSFSVCAVFILCLALAFGYKAFELTCWLGIGV